MKYTSRSEFFILYPLKWHYLARFGTLSKALYLRNLYQTTSYDKSKNSQGHSVRGNRSCKTLSSTKWQKVAGFGSRFCAVRRARSRPRIGHSRLRGVNDALFVSTRRHFFWRDRSDPGPGGELLPEPALAGIDERNHHAPAQRPFGRGYGPGSRFDRQVSDNPPTAPREAMLRTYCAYCQAWAHFKCAQYGFRSIQLSACAHLARGSTGKPVITRNRTGRGHTAHISARTPQA